MGLIYWVASYPKSGNTWMRVFLNNIVSDDLPASGLEGLLEFAPDENNGRFYAPLLERPLEEASIPELAALRPRVHRAAANLAPGFLFMKTHSMLARHAGTMTVTPEVTAGAIYIIRNPLDVAVSYSRFRDVAVATAIDTMNDRGRILPRTRHHGYVPTGSWSENVLSWTAKSNERILILKYEDLLDDALGQFSRVVRFLNMDASVERIEAAVAASSFSNLKAREQAEGFVERPATTSAFFRQGTADQWRSDLSESEIAAVTRANRAAMKMHGYWLPEFEKL